MAGATAATDPRHERGGPLLYLVITGFPQELIVLNVGASNQPVQRSQSCTVQLVLQTSHCDGIEVGTFGCGVSNIAEPSLACS